MKLTDKLRRRNALCKLVPVKHCMELKLEA